MAVLILAFFVSLIGVLNITKQRKDREENKIPRSLILDLLEPSLHVVQKVRGLVIESTWQERG
jgi:hypothetical protein